MAKFHINVLQLGPVKDFELRLAPVMLFTGASGLGKSYINFLAYYAYAVFSGERIYKYIESKLDVDIDNTDSFKLTIEFEDLKEWLEKDVVDFFRYLLNYPNIKCDIQFVFDCEETKIVFEYKGSKVKAHDGELIGATLDVNGRQESVMIFGGSLKRQVIISHLSNGLSRFLFETRIVRSILLPPGRASLMSSDYSTQSRSSKTGMYDIFLRDNDFINADVLRNESTPQEKKFFEEQIHNLIHGDLVYSKEGINYALDGGVSIPLEAAASSIKELAPLLMWILSGRIGNRSICVEEPEAHLHPQMQVDLANLLAACINKGAIMQITTHSDYFLQRVNQLIKLGRVKKENGEMFEKYYDENKLNPLYYLDEHLINAYYFHEENGLTKIEKSESGVEGLPLETFFDTIKYLSGEEEKINELIESCHNDK